MKQSMDLKKIYLNNFNRDQFIETINTHYTDEKSSVLVCADLLLKGHYIFQNEWDMERTQIPVIMDLDEMDWNYIPTPDMEWSYMLHRHGFLKDLVYAYAFTQDDKYIDHLLLFLKKFVEENPYNEINKPFSYRTIDVALRLLAWVGLFEMLDILEIEYDDVFHEVMASNAIYLEEHIVLDRTQSNWVAIECAGLIAYYNRVNQVNKLVKICDVYDVCLSNQVLDDGLQWEQSFMYHHEVLITALHVIAAMGDHVSELVLFKSELMAEASRKLTRTNHTQSNFGDSDYESMDAILLASEKLLSIDLHSSPVKSSLYDFGFTGDVSNSKGLYPQADYEFETLDQNGFLWLKNHEENHTFMFAHGPLGGGHGHDDFLHIDWMINGQEFLVDSGRYTYYEEDGSRLKYKSPLAHNVPVVNSSSYNVHIDSWSSSKVAQGMNERIIHREDVTYFQGGHFGYSNDEHMTFVNRRGFYFKSNHLILIDSIRSTQEQILSSNFVFAEDALNLQDDKVIYQTDDVQMKLKFLSNHSIVDKIDHVISPQYNLEKETVRLQVSKNMKQGHLITVISPLVMEDITLVDVYSDNGELYTESTVQCFKWNEENRSRYLLVQHTEPDDSRRAYRVEGHYVYGQVVSFEVKNDEVINKKVLV